MSGISGIALFCQDIRNEVEGTESLVGVMPDILSVPQMPAQLAQLCIYSRINFDPDIDVGDIQIVLVAVDKSEIVLINANQELIEESVGNVKKVNGPLAGIKSVAKTVGYPVVSAGAIKVYARSKLGETLLGALNLTLDSDKDK